MAERELYEWDGEKYVPGKGTPGADTIYWNGARWVPGKNPEGPNAFMRGLATGWEGIKDIPAVGYAMAQGALGDEQGSKDTLEAIKEKTEQNLAGGYQTRYTLEDVKKDPTKLGGWAAEQMGGAAASIGLGVAAALATGAALPAVGAGAVGTVATGAAARFGLGRMAAAAVQRGQAAAIAEAAQTGTAITAEQAAAQAIQGIGRNVAMTGAVGLASGAQNIPESFTTIFDETGQIRPGVAFSVGALKSSLDVLPITRLMARTRGPEFADRLTNLISARLASKYPGATGALAGSLESLAYEGLTEGAQALLDQTAMNIIADKSIDWENVLENAAGGGVGSMPFGAAAGFLGGRRARARGPRPAQETPPPGEVAPTVTPEGEVTPPVTPTGETAITPTGEGAPTVTPAGEGAVTPTGEVVPGGEAAPTVTPAGEGAPAVTPAGEAAPTDLDRLRAGLPQPGAEGFRRIMGAKWASDILGREVTPDEARQLFGELQKEGRVVQRGPGFMVPFKEVPLIDHLTSVVDSNEERYGQRFITIDQLRENLPEGDLAQMQDIVGQLGSQGVQITESAPAAGRVPALQQRLDEVLPQYKGQPAAGVFQTEKGSIYLTHDDGTTTRHKEAREEVGHEGDFGWKERTQKTVYVDPLMVGGLSAAGLQGVGSRGARLLIKDGKATLALWNDATNKWGITPSLANVPVYDKPAPGLAPLELWNKKDDVPAGFEGYASQHAGNKIVAMGPAPAIAPTEVTPTTEVTPAAEITPPATQPDASAILENISAAYKSLAGTDWQSYQGGRGPLILVADLLKSIRASNPQYTQEDLARDLHLVDRNPDLLTQDGARISFLASTVAKERKAKPVIFKDEQGRSFPYYAITFVKETPVEREVAPQWQEMPAGADTMRTEKIANSATLLKDARELWQGRTSFGQGLKSLLDLLTTETNRTTKEHAFALAGGEVVAFFSTNNKGMVRISDNRALATRMNDPGESFLLTHSHPSNTSFSVGDAASFGDSPGEKISVVRGNKGFTAFMVRPDFLWTKRYGGLLAKAGRAAKKIAVDMVYKDPAVQGTREQKFLAYTRLQNLALARLGLIRYTDTAPLSDLDFVPDWRAKIEKISKSMAAQSLNNHPSTQKAFADGNQYLDEHNRLAGSLGEPGGIERILQGPQAGAAGTAQAGRPAGMARPAPTAPRTGAARSEARLSEALDRANDIAGEIEGTREGLSAQQEKEHRRHYASLTSEERTDPRAKLLKKLLDYIDGTLKADQYALLDEVEATTDNYHPSVRAPREPKFAKTRKQPSIKISPRTLEEADYYQDNPAVSRGNTEWLLEKQRDADAWYRTTKGMNGAITAKFRNPVDLPVSVVSQVPGERDEQRKPGEPQFDRLLKKVRKEGWKPDPIDIYVNHRGEAFIYEGNTRAAVAKYLGIDTIPVYVGWLNGAEMVEGKWTPKNVLNMYPSEKAIVEPVRTPAAVAADVQQFQAINEQANTMLDEVSIPFSCRVKK